ncbi:hypothetical protein JW948_17100 [bacterium]|nr:hypothetical protein [bacterium]
MKSRGLIICLCILALLFGCDVDHGLEPMPGRLEVKAMFRGTPPADTQGAYLIVAPQFPPRAINELFQSPNSLPVGQDTVLTGIDLPYGHYEAYGLWWYSKDTRSNLADLLYLPMDLLTGEPIGFDITPEQPLVQRTMKPNWDNMNRDASIRGTVHFLGDFPQESDITAVAAFHAEPKSVIHYLVWLKSIDITIEPGVKSHDFILPVKSGQIGYIAIFWLPKNAPIYDIQIVAECYDPDHPDEFWEKVLAPGETVEGVQINVDWDHWKSLNTLEAQ